VPETLNSQAAIKAYDDFAAAAARDSFWTYRKHMPASDWFPRRLARELRTTILSLADEAVLPRTSSTKGFWTMSQWLACDSTACSECFAKRNSQIS
jgi:hypothetical protein